MMQLIVESQAKVVDFWSRRKMTLANSNSPAIILPLGLVAQLVEQRIENPCVGGSLPPRATKNIPSKTPTHAGWRFCFERRKPHGGPFPVQSSGASSSRSHHIVHLCKLNTLHRTGIAPRELAVPLMAGLS